MENTCDDKFRCSVSSDISPMKGKPILLLVHLPIHLNVFLTTVSYHQFDYVQIMF